MTHNQIKLPPHIDGLTRQALRRVEELLIYVDSGLKVVFEDESTPERPVPTQGTQDEALFVSRARVEENGGVETIPPQIHRFFKEDDWNYLIWMPRQFVYGDPRRMVIRYAHECQHYRQALDPSLLSVVRDFRAELIQEGFLPTIKVEKIPEEFDADRAAYEIFVDIYGKSGWDLYVMEESHDAQMANFFSRLGWMIERWYRFVETDGPHLTSGGTDGQ